MLGPLAHAASGHGEHGHLAARAREADDLHIERGAAVGGIGIGRAPVGHDDGAFSRHEVLAFAGSLEGLAHQRVLGIDVAEVDQRLQELESGAHVVAVAGLAGVQGLHLGGHVSSVVQIGVGLGENEGLQPPTVGADGRLIALLFENPTAFQKLLGRVRQRKLAFVEDILVHEQAVGHHLLGNGHELAIDRVGRAHHLAQVLGAGKPRQVGQVPLRPEGYDGIGVQQVQIVRIVAGPLQAHLVVGLVLVVLGRVGVIGQREPEPLLRHGDRQVAGRAGRVLGVGADLLHGTEEVHRAPLVGILHGQILRRRRSAAGPEH